jgi:hypothetical protein
MSPTEHDLRAALSDGEGDGLDADRLIASGRAHQARRRVQLLTTAAVIVVAAGAGTGIAALVRGGGGKTNAGSALAGGTAASAARGYAAGGGGSAATSSGAEAPVGRNQKAASAAIACPASLPRYALPGGGSPGQFGADGQLFSRPVQQVIVCGYGASANQAEKSSGTSSAPRQATLSDAQATRLAASLNDAGHSPGALCPRTAAATPEGEFAIIGVAADGKVVGTVTVTRSSSACGGAQVTNGTAVRYNWTPPRDLAAILAKLTK